MNTNTHTAYAFTTTDTADKRKAFSKSVCIADGDSLLVTVWELSNGQYQVTDRTCDSFSDPETYNNEYAAMVDAWERLGRSQGCCEPNLMDHVELAMVQHERDELREKLRVTGDDLAAANARAQTYLGQARDAAQAAHRSYTPPQSNPTLYRITLEGLGS